MPAPCTRYAQYISPATHVCAGHSADEPPRNRTSYPGITAGQGHETVPERPNTPPHAPAQANRKPRSQKRPNQHKRNRPAGGGGYSHQRKPGDDSAHPPFFSPAIFGWAFPQVAGLCLGWLRGGSPLVGVYNPQVWKVWCRLLMIWGRRVGTCGMS